METIEQAIKRIRQLDGSDFKKIEEFLKKLPNVCKAEKLSTEFANSLRENVIDLEQWECIRFLIEENLLTNNYIEKKTEKPEQIGRSAIALSFSQLDKGKPETIQEFFNTFPVDAKAKFITELSQSEKLRNQWKGISDIVNEGLVKIDNKKLLKEINTALSEILSFQKVSKIINTINATLDRADQQDCLTMRKYLERLDTLNTQAVEDFINSFPVVYGSRFINEFISALNEPTLRVKWHNISNLYAQNTIKNFSSSNEKLFTQINNSLNNQELLSIVNKFNEMDIDNPEEIPGFFNSFVDCNKEFLIESFTEYLDQNKGVYEKWRVLKDKNLKLEEKNVSRMLKINEHLEILDILYELKKLDTSNIEDVNNFLDSIKKHVTTPLFKITFAKHFEKNNIVYTKWNEIKQLITTKKVTDTSEIKNLLFFTYTINEFQLLDINNIANVNVFLTLLSRGELNSNFQESFAKYIAKNKNSYTKWQTIHTLFTSKKLNSDNNICTAIDSIVSRELIKKFEDYTSKVTTSLETVLLPTEVSAKKTSTPIKISLSALKKNKLFVQNINCYKNSLRNIKHFNMSIKELETEAKYSEQSIQGVQPVVNAFKKLSTSLSDKIHSTIKGKGFTSSSLHKLKNCSLTANENVKLFKNQISIIEYEKQVKLLSLTLGDQIKIDIKTALTTIFSSITGFFTGAFAAFWIPVPGTSWIGGLIGAIIAGKLAASHSYSYFEMLAMMDHKDDEIRKNSAEAIKQFNVFNSQRKNKEDSQKRNSYLLQGTKIDISQKPLEKLSIHELIEVAAKSNSPKKDDATKLLFTDRFTELKEFLDNPSTTFFSRAIKNFNIVINSNLKNEKYRFDEWPIWPYFSQIAVKIPFKQRVDQVLDKFKTVTSDKDFFKLMHMLPQIISMEAETDITSITKLYNFLNPLQNNTNSIFSATADRISNPNNPASDDEIKKYLLNVKNFIIKANKNFNSFCDSYKNKQFTQLYCRHFDDVKIEPKQSKQEEDEDVSEDSLFVKLIEIAKNDFKTAEIVFSDKHYPDLEKLVNFATKSPNVLIAIVEVVNKHWGSLKEMSEACPNIHKLWKNNLLIASQFPLSIRFDYLMKKYNRLQYPEININNAGENPNIFKGEVMILLPKLIANNNIKGTPNECANLLLLLFEIKKKYFSNENFFEAATLMKEENYLNDFKSLIARAQDNSACQNNTEYQILYIKYKDKDSTYETKVLPPQNKEAEQDEYFDPRDSKVIASLLS